MEKAKIKVSITTNELTEQVKNDMWVVYQQYYNYDRPYFMSRIDSNNYFSFYLVEGRIIGFTGLRINRTEVEGRECLLIYFGQTVIDKQYRGYALIPRTAAKLLLKYWKDLLQGRIYVWADALSYKAYMVFAKTIGEYYPSYKASTPKHVQALINFVGEEYYGENFCQQSGTVVKNTVFVNDASTIIDTQREKDKDVLFYAASNPNYIKGHGLITLAPMHSRNYLIMLVKCIRKLLFGKSDKASKTAVLHAVKVK